MPNFCSFRDKQTGEVAHLETIDNRICAFLGREPHPKFYCGVWEYVQLMVAIGQTFQTVVTEARKREADPNETLKRGPAGLGQLTAICALLSDNYTSDAWATIGK